jgi:hypothetical protein
MVAAESDGRFDHPSFVTALSTVLAYALVLVGMTLLLFALPYLIFSFV